MEASWHQNRSQNRAYLKSGRKRADTEKTIDFLWFLWIWEASWQRKPIKSRLKIEGNIGRLGIDFWLIFVDFGRQVGREIDPRSNAIRFKSASKKWCKQQSHGGARSSAACGPGGPTPPPHPGHARLIDKASVCEYQAPRTRKVPLNAHTPLGGGLSNYLQ